MKVVRHIAELRKQLAEERVSGASRRTIGFVPTMGYLHEGHISLVREARKRSDIVVLSIFVNPLQFGPNEDFERYPRDEDRDLAIAAENGVDFVFMPDVVEMYPRPMDMKVTVSERISNKLCGRSRPGHFDGVATVVLKLFQIVQPDLAFFGLKDAQQVAVIRRMTDDFNVPVEIVACPTVREPDGLAKSSRNVYLSEEERKQAVVLYEALQAAEHLIRKESNTTPRQLREMIKERIGRAPSAELDYAEVVEYPSLNELAPDQPLAQCGVVSTDEKLRHILIAIAVRFGATRLIDNTLVTFGDKPAEPAHIRNEEGEICSER